MSQASRNYLDDMARRPGAQEPATFGETWEARRQQKILLIMFLAIAGAIAGVTFLGWAGRCSLPWLGTYIGQPSIRKTRKGWARFTGWWLAD